MMKRNPAALTEHEFDLAIIGGGILGAGIARDAALRGLSVALVEKGDFASGTSSRSTKLIHGGLRYLEQFAFGLVAEACRERSLLLDMAPHLVRPLSMLLPVYQRDPRSLLKVRLGMTIYDWCVPSRHRLTPRHVRLTPAEVMVEEPQLQRDGLRGAVLFYDCQMDDARLCLETILDAVRNGAVGVNYCAVTGFRREWDRIVAAQVTDQLTGEHLDLRARLYVNAAGPWVERVARVLGSESTVALSPTKGIHLVIPRVLRKHGVYFQSPRDGRLIFVLPWDQASLLGTTDTDYTHSPDAVAADSADVAYLQEQLRAVLPDAPLNRGDLITSFAGVRALLQADRDRPSSRSREERIIWQGENLLTVAGGKYTTFRAIADRAVRKAFRRLRRTAPPCPTAQTALPNRRPTASGDALCESPSVYESDIIQACDQELAVTVSDVMRRRTRLALSSHGGPEVADRVSRIMAERLGWNAATRDSSLRQYAEEWRRSQPWLANTGSANAVE